MLADDNKVQCEKCESLQDHCEKVDIQATGNVLIIQLKRFVKGEKERNT